MVGLFWAPIDTMGNKPSFAERISALKAAAEVVMTELLRMEAAEQRFAARKGDRRQTQRQTEKAGR